MKIRRITQILVVDAIEPLLPLWKGALDFKPLAEVPEGEHLGFVLLARDEQHVMIQTRASLKKDVPAIAALDVDSFTYVDVDSLADADALMKGAEVLVPRRTTFYGAHETFYRDGAGESYHCAFGLNPRYRATLEDAGLRFTETDDDGDPRALELPGHPFFLGMLFQFELAALRGETPPIAVAFVRAAAAD